MFMKLFSKKLTYLILVGLFIMLILPTAALANLPGADLFTPDLALVSDMVNPIFVIITWGLGGYGLWLLLTSFWSLLKIAAAFFSGTRMEGGKESLKSVAIGVTIVLITITGVWYKMLMAIWNKLGPKLEQVSFIEPDTFYNFIDITTKWFT